jgi:LysR family transcriptional regulator for metE and metH
MPRDLLRYSSLELRHLRLVSAVAEARGLTNAAKRLRLTTSALSHQLRQLEALAGAAVFTREGRTMRPTPAGEMLLEAAGRALEVVHDAEERLRGGARHAEAVRLCAHCGTGYYWLPPVVRAFQRTHKHVDLRIVPEVASRPFDALVARDLDLVLSFDPPAGGNLFTQPLFHDEIVLLVSKEHRLAGEKFIPLRELAEEHLMLYSETLEDSYLAANYLFPANIRPRRFTCLALTEAILEMVKANLGVTAMARWATSAALEQSSIVPKRLTARGVMRTWSAVTRERPAPGSALAALIDQIKAHTASTRFAATKSIKGRTMRQRAVRSV